jgi:tRNA threonylcarbamoyl adenosine modification protein (Sua5/YciO/YrdC/YwlC family)
MIHFVIAQNLDNRVIEKVKAALLQDQIFALPTDTTWAFAASPQSKKALDKLLSFKRGPLGHESKPALLCKDIAQAAQYAQMETPVFKLMRSLVPGPYTFILNVRTDAPRVLKNSRSNNQIGIRIPQDPLCLELLDKIDTPLLVSSLHKEMLWDRISDKDMKQGLGDELYSFQIEEAYASELSLIIDPGNYSFAGKSTMVDLTHLETEGPVVLRQGLGNFFSR